jgi:hypothetical protein
VTEREVRGPGRGIVVQDTDTVFQTSADRQSVADDDLEIAC